MSHLTLDNTMGAAFISVVIAALCTGCMEIWYYYRHYSDKDVWITKSLVAATWICETIHQALICHTVYTYVITNYDNPNELTNIVWSLIVEVLFNGITALLVQMFFTIRVWKLSNRNKTLTISVGILVMAEFGSVLAYIAKALPMKTFSQLNTLKALSMTINALAAAGDVLIAAVFCAMLHTSRTGFKRSDTMINKLIMFSVNTGLLTSLCAIGSLVSIIVSSTTFIYICFYFLLGRLYFNSLLATLNARKSIRGQGENSAYSLSLQVVEGSNGTVPTPKFVNNDIAIRIDTAQDFMTDRESSKTSSGDEKVEMHREVV